MKLQLKQDQPEAEYEDMQGLRLHMMKMCAHADKERTYDASYFPCFACGGKGKIRKPEDRDPVEGYKMAPWHICEKCGGSGEMSQSDYEPILEHYLNDFEARSKRYADDAKRLRDIKNKLDEADIIFLLDHCTYR